MSNLRLEKTKYVLNSSDWGMFSACSLKNFGQRSFQNIMKESVSPSDLNSVPIPASLFASQSDLVFFYMAQLLFLLSCYFLTRVVSALLQYIKWEAGREERGAGSGKRETGSGKAGSSGCVSGELALNLTFDQSERVPHCWLHYFALVNTNNFRKAG